MRDYKPFRVCPICNADKVAKVYDITFRLFDGHPMGDGYTLVQCQNCFFVYADTHITQEILDKYYKELSKYEDKRIGTGGGYSKNDKERLVKLAAFISSQFPDKSARIIDLGCANGGLLKELKNLGYYNIAGLDPSERCVEITRSEVGCEVHQMSLFAVDENLGKFDLVILSHVLEHLLELSSTLHMLKQLLDEGGVVYVECPNAQNYNKVIHAPLQEFNTEHINHFTEVSFENLFGLNGFKKIATGNKTDKIASDRDYHSVYGLFEKSGKDFKYQVVPDVFISGSIMDYIAKSEQIFESIIRKLPSGEYSRTIAFYGIGQFAFKLLSRVAETDHLDLRFFDNNSLNIGKTVNGIKILPGNFILKEYKKSPFEIVITSLVHESGIRKQIQEEFISNSVSSPNIIGFENCL
jgi:2-polyprenyl-3-methyl-5-hydroxy-6-metoxy-1,4-benzoquinol methylase